MAALVWNQSAERKYEHGLDRGVLFVRDTNGDYQTGVVWDGLTTVTKSPEGGEPTDLWAGNIKYATMLSAEKMKGTIEAYRSPVEFDVCDGAAALDVAGGVVADLQARRGFGLAYRTLIGSDAVGTQAGYKIHLIWGLLISPSEKNATTLNDNPEATTLSWEFESTPAEVGGTFNPSSTIVIDSMTATAAFMAWLEEELWGDADTDSNLPSPDTIRTQAVALV